MSTAWVAVTDPVAKFSPGPSPTGSFPSTFSTPCVSSLVRARCSAKFWALVFSCGGEILLNCGEAEQIYKGELSFFLSSFFLSKFKRRSKRSKPLGPNKHGSMFVVWGIKAVLRPQWPQKLIFIVN